MFSGNRGVHVMALHVPAGTNRRALFDRLSTRVPETLRRVARLVERTLGGQSTRLTLSRVCGSTPFRYLACSRDVSAEDAAVVVECYVEPWILDTYGHVLLPHFTEWWTPTVLSAKAPIVEAVAVAVRTVQEKYPEVGRACDALAASYVGASIALEERIDVFLAVTALLWMCPDENLRSESHMLRVPFSPHGKSGNVCLPLEIARSHNFNPHAEFCGVSRQPSAYFTRALELAEDALAQAVR